MNWPDYFSKMFPPPAAETRDRHDVSAASKLTPAAQFKFAHAIPSSPMAAMGCPDLNPKFARASSPCFAWAARLCSPAWAGVFTSGGSR